MVVSPDTVERSYVLQEHVDPSLILPLRRSRSMAESIAWHTQASEVPIEQVVSIWARQKGVEFVGEMLQSQTYSNLSETEKERLLRFAGSIVAEDWLRSLGYGTHAVGVDDKIFHHKSLLT